jgi:putative tryptophan/tyrosine transport system substrate-binding protein
MDRRAFISMVGGSFLVALAVEAQQAGAKIPRIGVLQPGSPPEPLLEALREGLRDLGYSEGRNLILEVRWAQGSGERISELAAELVALRVDLIATLSTPAALAARRATSTIPIVFTGVGDPVGSGVVPSLARPEGNATGVSTLATELSAKRLEILREIVPRISRLAMLWNDTNPSMVLRAREAELAATKLGVTIQSLGVHNLTDFDLAFRAIETERSAGLLTLVDPFTRQHRKRIVDFAAQRRLPAIYESREFVDAGGLLCYGPSLTALQRRAASYVDKILRGAKPADLPVEQPTKFELIINLRTAQTLGLTIPQTLLLRADQLIQ